MIVYKLYILCFLGIFILNGCQSNEHDPLEVVAKAGNQYLTKDMVGNLIPENISDEEKDLFVKNLIDKWIERQLLSQYAIREGIELTSEDEWQLEKMRMEILTTKLLNKKIKRDIPVTDKEIEDYYEKNQDQFQREKDEVHLVYLFQEKLDKAIVKEIKQSKLLLDVIKKNFLEGQGNQLNESNGDLGYVPLKTLRSEFRWAIRGKKTGIIYGPVKTKEGYHYLQVLDRQPAESIRSLDLIHDEIVALVQIEKREQLINNLKENTLKDLPVETFYNNVD